MAVRTAGPHRQVPTRAEREPSPASTATNASAVRAPRPAAPGTGTQSGVMLAAFGLVVFIVCVAVSAATYSHAQEQGGRYVVLWGPALFGLVMIGVGLSRARRASTAARPQWHPDPTGRHQHRYWSGTEWTHHVADAGVQGSDPLGEDAGPLPATSVAEDRSPGGVT